jgi:hypothetical protein
MILALMLIFLEALVLFAAFAVWMAWTQTPQGEHKSTVKTQYVHHGDKHRAQHSA